MSIYEPQLPNEIRQKIQNMKRCSNCQFVIFDNYWTDEVENVSLKVCPTCGVKLSQ